MQEKMMQSVFSAMGVKPGQVQQVFAAVDELNARLTRIEEKLDKILTIAESESE